MRMLLLSVTSAMVVSGCATSNPEAPSARVEIQEEVGFTIVEETRISNDVRIDYNEALLFLEQGQTERGTVLLESVVEAAPHLTAPAREKGVPRCYR